MLYVIHFKDYFKKNTILGVSTRLFDIFFTQLNK